MANVLTSLKANQSLKRRLLSPKTGIPLAALVLVIVLLTNKVDIGFSDTWEHITTLNPWWYAAAFVSHYSTFIFRGRALARADSQRTPPRRRAAPHGGVRGTGHPHGVVRELGDVVQDGRCLPRLRVRG